MLPPAAVLGATGSPRTPRASTARKPFRAKGPSTKRPEARGPRGFSLPSADAPGNRDIPPSHEAGRRGGPKPKGTVMGNRAVITVAERKIGLNLHWNGGRDTVEPLLRHCELKGCRAPISNDYGRTRLCQIVGNFFGGTLSVGIMPYSDYGRTDPGDNGIHVIEGWRIADRILPYKGFVEQDQYDFDEMLRAFDESMPEGEQLGALLDAEEIPSSELEVGDEIWVSDFDGRWEHYPVVARSEEGRRSSPNTTTAATGAGTQTTGSDPTPPSSSRGSRRKREGSRPAGGSLPIVLPIAVAPGLRVPDPRQGASPLHPSAVSEALASRFS